MYKCPKCIVMRDFDGKSTDPSHCSRKQFYECFEGNGTECELCFEDKSKHVGESLICPLKTGMMCCNCCIKEGTPQIRCNQCLQRPLQAVTSDGAGSPPKGPMEVQSITVENLEKLLTNLHQKIKPDEPMTSNHIRMYLQTGKNLHPAKEWKSLFSAEKAQAPLTYTWSLPLDGVLKHLKALDMPKMRIWIDVLFVDQLSKHIQLDLGMVQEHYALAEFHIAIICVSRNVRGESESILDRAWCILELCIRNKAGKSTRFVGDGKCVKNPGFDYLGGMGCHADDRDALMWALRTAYEWGGGGTVNGAVGDQISKGEFQTVF